MVAPVNRIRSYLDTGIVKTTEPPKPVESDGDLIDLDDPTFTGLRRAAGITCPVRLTREAFEQAIQKGLPREQRYPHGTMWALRAACLMKALNVSLESTERVGATVVFGFTVVAVASCKSLADMAEQASQSVYLKASVGKDARGETAITVELEG